jgi:hypothetical protein
MKFSHLSTELACDGVSGLYQHRFSCHLNTVSGLYHSAKSNLINSWAIDTDTSQ